MNDVNIMYQYYYSSLKHQLVNVHTIIKSVRSIIIILFVLNVVVFRLPILAIISQLTTNIH